MSEGEPIATAIRIRPILSTQTRSDHNCINIDHNRLSIATHHQLKNFDLPSVFPPTATQQQIFQRLVQPLVEDFCKGYSCSFFCCGQNGSGKTYTIEGGETPQAKGVISRIADYLALKLVGEDSSTTYLLRVSYIEIYEQEIIDLLQVRRGRRVKIAEHGRQIQLAGLQLKHISNLQDIEAFYVLGNRKRRYAYKQKTRNPQKSTAIFTLYLESCQQGAQSIRKGKLSIVDMSASKTISKLQLPNEYIFKTNHYDLSLNAFRNVVMALAYGDKDCKVPYNDSKVTLILRQYLGGFGRAKVLFHLYPGAKGLSASLDSIRIAKHLSLIQNYPHFNPDPTHLTIVNLLQELEQTKTAFQDTEKSIKDILEQRSKHSEQQQGNQFLDKEFFEKQQEEERNQMLKQLQQQKKKLKKRVEGLSSLFLNFRSKDREVSYEMKKKYMEVMGPLRSLADSAQKYTREISETEERGRNSNRAHKMQIFQLQKEFQQERSTLLQRIRQLEGDFKFYQTVSQQTVRKDEIDLLRHSSHYDETTRSYNLPKFAVLHKKLSFADRLHSSSSRNGIQRTFYLSGRSYDRLRDSISKRSGGSSRVKQIKSGVELEEEYFERSKKKQLKKLKDIPIVAERADQYQLNEGRKRLKRNQRGSTKNMFKQLTRATLR